MSEKQRGPGEAHGWTFTSANQELNNKVINWLSGKTEQNQRQLSHKRATRRVAHKDVKITEMLINLLGFF